MYRFLFILFVVIIIGSSLIFIKIKGHYSTNSVNSSVEKDLNDTNANINKNEKLSNFTNSTNNTITNHHDTPKDSLKKFVFYEFDNRSNAQAMLEHLKKQNIGFPIKITSLSDRIGLYFNYQDLHAKNKKIQKISNCTGLKLQNVE